MGQPAERAEPVVDRDDDRALFGELFAVVARLGSGAAGEAGAVNPDHHGQPFRRGTGRGPHVEEQAILARGLLSPDASWGLASALPSSAPTLAARSSGLIARRRAATAAALPSSGAPSSRAAPRAALHAARAVLVGGANALPFRDGLRRLPAQRAERWRRVGNAAEDANVAARAGRAREQSTVEAHGIGNSRGHKGRDRQDGTGNGEQRKSFHRDPFG